MTPEAPSVVQPSQSAPPGVAPPLPPGPNPYVGPRPFKTGEPIFGRSDEIRDLYYLLNAERIVRLYSPSGAGKSSLVMAGLVPRLREGGFDVWPTIRVSSEAAPGSEGNRYARSTMLSLEEGLPERLRKEGNTLGAMTLEEYVRARPRKRGASPNVVLIFDQFEEILTVDPLGEAAKQAFFEQLGQLLLHPDIWALFVIREDYFAPLDRYAVLLPTQLRNRFRLDLLGLDAARQAIEEPARAAGRVYAPGVAAELVQNLAKVLVQQPSGDRVEEVGQYVEPVQLQVVCRRLWDAMPEHDRSIDSEDVRNLLDVTQALRDYYESSVGDRNITGGDQKVERRIREWFSTKLIVSGIRGQVMQGKGVTEGLDNQLIARLEKTHLIRAEKRRGTTFYELAHDRLVQPVSRSNQEWFAKHLEEFQRRAPAWDESGQSEALLLTGKNLAEAEKWTAQNPGGLSEAETLFLKASSARRKQQKGRRRLYALFAAVVFVGFVFLVFAWSDAASSFQTAQEALKGQQQAMADAEDARQARDRTFLSLLSKSIAYPISSVLEDTGTGGGLEHDPDWETLVSEGDQAFVIARTFGPSNQGRVMAAGHDGFLVHTDPEFNDNPFLEVSLTWLRGSGKAVVLLSDKPSDAVQIYAREKFAQFKKRLASLGYEVRPSQDLSQSAGLNNAGIVIIGNSWGDFTAQELEAITDFVNKGGGLLGVGLGWSWRDYGPIPRPVRNPPPGTPLEKYPMNVLFQRFGARWNGQPIFLKR